MTFPLSAQSLSQADFDYMHSQEDTLGLLAYSVLNDSTAEERFLACREMIPKLVNSLKRPHSFDYPFERLGQYVSIQYPADSSFRILTWQLHVNRDEYRYYGAIQRNTEELTLFPLIDRSFELPDPIEQLELTPDRWYGNVVYHIQTVEVAGGEPYYLLYGFDSFEAYRRRKLVDVLYFDSGKPAFGMPVFGATAGDRLPAKRLLLEYSAAVAVTLRYDQDLGQIMHDHLILVEGTHGEGPVYVPDGSYEAYAPNPDGSWDYIEKVFHQISSEPPRDRPATSGEDRDLFGRRQ